MAQVKGEMPNQRDEKGERLSGGLEKVMLAGNRIADEGASALASSLKLDLWMLGILPYPRCADVHIKRASDNSVLT